MIFQKLSDERDFIQTVRSFGALLLILLCCFQPAFAMINAGNDEKSRNKKPPVLTENQRISQILSRLTFGARPEDIERVKRIGVKTYIEEQLNSENIDDSKLELRLAKLPTLSLATPTIVERYNPPKPAATPTPIPKPSPNYVMPEISPTPQTAPTPQIVSTPAPTLSPTPKPTPKPHNPQEVVTELQRAAILRAVYSEKQLNEVMVEFWMNHFSIYSQKDADRWLLTGFAREAVRPFALGHFRDLLSATAKSPAMLYYLDNWQSSVTRNYPAANGKPARQSGGINENYARELMELHTLGVNGGYTQKDVQEVARCFTGWTIRKPNEEGIFIYNPAAHDDGEKVVLGQKIPAFGGIADGEKVLDILAKNPATARFISTKLARRFIGDNPPQAVIERASQIFLKTDGSIKETLRSIITSPEFLAASNYRSKVKPPFEFVASALRVTSAETDADRPIIDWISRMGQPIFGRIPPDGYPERADEWLSSGGLVARLNFANALAANKIKGTKYDVAKIIADVDENNPSLVASKLISVVLANEITPRTKNELDKLAAKAADTTKAANQPTNDATKAVSFSNVNAKQPSKTPDYVIELVTLLIGSLEFQQK